jgi:hypothetical protein
LCCRTAVDTSIGDVPFVVADLPDETVVVAIAKRSVLLHHAVELIADADTYEEVW